MREDDIIGALDRILSSDTFAAVGRLRKFLQYVVETAVAGRQEQIKETVIAIDVYGRDADFDPRTNPLVRVDASRLRRRIKEYYAGEGTEDPLRIELPKGTYVPRFIEVTEREQPQNSSGNRPTSVTGARSLPCVAIFEFTVLDDGDEFLGRGLSQEIKHHLLRFADLRVIAPCAASRDESLTEAQRSGAQYLLEGSVQRSSDRVRVIATLQYLPSNEQLWSERWERDLNPTTLFELQDEIAERTVGIVGSPFGAISRDRLYRGAELSPQELDTYEWIARYHDYQRHETKTGNTDLRRVFRAVTEEDPTYAQAWAILSQLELDLWRFNFDQDSTADQALATASKLASQALDIDPANTLAISNQAAVCAHRKDFSGLVEKANRIMSVNPCDARAVGWIGLWYAMFEEWEPALSYTRRARELNPLDISTTDFVEALHAMSENEAARAWSLMQTYRDLDVMWAQLFCAITDYMAGYPDSARRALGAMYDINPRIDVKRDLQKYPFSDRAIESWTNTISCIADL